MDQEQKNKKNLQLLSGNEALARGAWECGVSVAASYPGTPATEIVESLIACPEVDVQWSVNEKVAFEVALGASWCGVRALYASKHVGLNAAMDPLMTSSYTGVNAGFVIAVADDPGMFSSQNEQDTRWVGLYAKLPVLEPSSPEEAYHFVKEAYSLSEQFDTPVILRLTTRVAHSKQGVAIHPRTNPPRGSFKKNIEKYVMTPRIGLVRHGIVEKRLVALKEYSEACALNRIDEGDPNMGFVTDGICYEYIRETYPHAAVLKLGMVHPLCDDKIISFAQKVKKLIVVEELDPYLATHIKALGLNVLAKDPSFAVGELRPEHIEAIVQGKSVKQVPHSNGNPQFCAGCPYHHVFSVIREFDCTVSGDIGCYTLGAHEPYNALHTVLCMGASITVQEGMRRAEHTPVLGVIGDSTFLHSGIPGLINSVHNHCRGVLVILDNATTAMTGFQSHAATGYAIDGTVCEQVSLTALCKACGVQQVAHISAKETDTFRKLLRDGMQADTYSVIVVSGPCPQALRKRKIRRDH